MRVSFAEQFIQFGPILSVKQCAQYIIVYVSHMSVAAVMHDWLLCETAVTDICTLEDNWVIPGVHRSMLQRHAST